jgi:glycosyltransferase involved in cell wall biosynthesis
MCIFNFNYGRYLRQCFDSVLNQTYNNIEICFSDNASTDDSWEIALEYIRKYPGIMAITRNRKNFGTDANWSNCWVNVRGKYYVEVCSDDALMPDFTAKCVNALETNPKAGFAMVHRLIIDEHGSPTEEPPFYNQTCIIPGPEQAAVYMMAAVNPSVSQIMYNKKMSLEKSGMGGIASRWYGTRIMDFNMCCDYSMVYIKEPLMMHRLHSMNDSLRAAGTLMEVIGPYVLQHQFADIASHYNLTKAADRLPASLAKLSNLCLRYCVRSLTAQDHKCASQYYHLAAAIMPDISSDSVFQALEEYWASNDQRRLEILKSLQGTDNLTTRSVSYDPPPGSIPLSM